MFHEILRIDIDIFNCLCYNMAEAIDMQEKSEVITNIFIAGLNGLLAIGTDEIGQIVSIIGMCISIAYNVFVIIRAVIRHRKNKHTAGECDCADEISEAVDEIEDEVNKHVGK